MAVRGRIAAVIGAGMGLFGIIPPILALEDKNCSRLQSVSTAVRERIERGEARSAARARAIEQASKDAVAQVIGIEVQSRRENKTEIADDKARSWFRQIEQSGLGGFARPKVVGERDEGDIIVMDVVVTVCVPTDEFLRQQAKQRAERERKPPAPVDPAAEPWFDPKTGQARVWYWRRNKTFEFFDAEGFHPRYGGRLQPVTEKIRDEWQEAANAERQRAAAAAAQAARQAEEEAARRSALAKAAETCDRLAANPNDLRRPASVPGADFDIVRANAQEAVAACQAAADRYPGEPRYRYQLARAYQKLNPKRAASLLDELMKQRYAAAFDNYGWLLLDPGFRPVPDYAGAAKALRQGAAIGDPSAMLSLAKLIRRNQVDGSLEHATTLAQRAATLGHTDAAAELTALQQAAEDAAAATALAATKAEAERRQQEQIQQFFFDTLRGIMNRGPR